MVCILSFQVLYFNLLLYSRHTKTARLEVPPLPAAALTRPRPGGQRARPRRRRRPRPALACVAVVYVFFATAAPAGGARGGQVPRARRRDVGGTVVNLFFAAAVPAGCARRGNVCVEILQRGRRRNSTAGKLSKTYEIMHNAATSKMNQYLCSAKICERWESLDPILMQICKISKPGDVHKKIHQSN